MSLPSGPRRVASVIVVLALAICGAAFSEQVVPTNGAPQGPRTGMILGQATDGAFSVKGLPAGEYFVAALTDLESGEWNDPTLLEQLVRSAVTVTLRENQTTRQDLRIGGLK